MRVVVLGGAGAMGRVCVRDLVSSGVEDVIVADRDLAGAQGVAASAAGPGSASGRRVDVGDREDLVDLLAGADVVANCTNYALNPVVMRAAAAAGTDYLDLGGLYRGTRRQLELASDIEEAGILCLMGMGSTPGTMNVMAAAGAERLDEVHEIHLRCGGFDPEPPLAPLPVPYAIDTILDEFTLPAVVVTDGELAEIPAATEDEAFPFAEPVGIQNAIATLHSELATMPDTLGTRGLKEMTFKVAFGDDFIHNYRLISSLGLAGTEPMSLPDGTRVVPRDVLKTHALAVPQSFSGEDVESLVVILRGTRDGQPTEVRVEEVSYPNPEYGVGGADANTGIPPSIVAQMMANGEIKGAGVFGPESVVPHASYFEQLARRNIHVNVVEGPVGSQRLGVSR
jgi:saccharopine dehydrogenase-like NADP-dependent oxidoreductase